VIKNMIIMLLVSALLTGGYLANRRIEGLQTALALQQIQHKKALMKTRIKERAKRSLAALPVIGLLAAGWFEKQEYDEWKRENPDGSPARYAREMTQLVKEMSEEYYQAIKEASHQYSGITGSALAKTFHCCAGG